MSRSCSVACAAAFVSCVGLAGCKYDSSFAVASAEWDPQLRARDDALLASGLDKRPSTDANIHSDVKILRPSAGTQASRDWTFDLLYVVSAPVYVIWDGLLHVVLTDTDSQWRPRFETRLFYADPGKPADPTATTPANPPVKGDLIHDDETFEVHLNYLAIDYFTGGRLRDAWGGQGGQVSVQTSLNALSDAGMLVSEDTKFVVENEIRRRSPLLALAKGTAKGREFVDEVTSRAKAVLEKAQELELVADKVEGYVEQIQAKVDGEARKVELERLRKEALGLVDGGIAKHFPNVDQAQLARQLADSIVNSVFDEIARHLNDADVDQAAEWVKRVAARAQRHLDHASVVLDYFEKYGVDEEGIYETAKIIVGLADADRRSTLEFENVKPSLMQFPGEAGGGTAATLLGAELNDAGTNVLDKEYAFWTRNPGEAASPERDGDLFHAALRDDAIDQKPKGSTGPVVSERGLVYRGTLQELSRSMTGVKGFSLSFLMIDRGDDRVVRALRTLQQYTDRSGITVGGGGAQIQLSAIVDGLATLAQRISEDKVELRTIDLRFMSEAPRNGSTPGHELFALRPCTILISRNLKGTKFGAVAEITIRKAP